LTVLAAGGLALLLLRAPEARSWLLATAGLLALLVVYGTVRIVAATNNDYGITLRLIQPNIAQNLKWDARAAERHFERLLQLSRVPADKRLSAVIWPESAVAWPLDRDTARRMAAVSTLPEGAVLITGMNRWDFPEAGDAPPHPYNSLFVFDRSGAVRAAYDKHRLVPFGEYVPLRWLFNVDKVAGGAMTDFVPGAAGVKTVPAIAGLPSFSPLICYEAIYPGGVARRGKGRPQWLLNITNDAWFGLSAGPYQHLAMTRMRSIEEGLSLVRVANTGMTTVFDPWGRSLVRTALAEERVLDVPLQAAITPPLFARFGNAIPATLLGLCALVAVFSHLRSRHAEIIDPALSPVSR
jgi:apolipoprotein N-acyltransferase